MVMTTVNVRCPKCGTDHSAVPPSRRDLAFPCRTCGAKLRVELARGGLGVPAVASVTAKGKAVPQ